MAPSIGAEPPRERPFLFGGGAIPKKAPLARDPWLPTGAPTANGRARPADAEPPGCSPRAPVCVHRAPDASEAAARRALSALERAYRRLVDVLGYPRPSGDAGAGGSDALDLYLTRGRARVQAHADATATGHFDRASAHCVVGDAELLEREAALCLGEAIALGLDPGETPHLRRAFATHLWWAIEPPTSADFEAVDDFQSTPERAVATREIETNAEGAALFFEYLDARRGRASPGTLAVDLFTVGVGKTPPNAWLWDNAPDVFDALRRSLDDKPRDLAMLFAGLAVDRAFLGSRDDGEHWPALEWTGTFGRPRFDWSIKLSSLPRRVASLRPIEPNGAMYVWLELDQELGDKELAFQAEWESPVSFQWTLVNVDAEGKELGRIYAPFVERGTEVQQSLSDLKGVRGVLVVGTNLGGISPSYPFDPDYSPFEPHGATVYLTKL